MQDHSSKRRFLNESAESLVLRGGFYIIMQSSSDGYITAPSWKGPYTMHTVVGDSASPAVEDPFGEPSD